ncbi:MAG: FAD-binding protein [Proteobacteria bacterium]|nr:FAD-binding protein [Pseudomonadota bacterium]
MDQQIIKALEKIIGKEHLTTTPEELLCYSYDATAREFPPAAVAFPGNTEEVAAIMRLANQLSFPVVPRGAGTGMTGGALPIAGGLVMAMSRFNRILEIDSENHIAVVEPGVITGDFQNAVKKLGLFYPPDPASHKFCSLGGNVAECAGGPSAVKYGVTRDYVLGLEVVLPDGRILTTGTRTAKGVVGYDLSRLFVGSEGTLGIITKIILRLLTNPEARVSFLIAVESLAAATALVAKILASHRPCTLEYMDRTAIKIVSASLPFSLPEQTEAILILELDGDKKIIETQSEELLDFLQSQPGIIEISKADTDEEREAIWSARRAVSPAAFQLKPHKISEDVVVPRTKIPELVAFMEQLALDLDVIIFTFGHAGDGNIHVNIMLDKANPEEALRGETAKRQLFEKVISLSGTLSGEHGIGITKAEFLPLELDPNTLSVMQEIKNLFDPNNILNPGKIFPPQKKTT